MRINFSAPLYAYQPYIQPALRPFNRLLGTLLRPFLQPPIPHRYVRKAPPHYVESNRFLHPPARSTRHANYDETLRRDDPHAARIHKRSFDKQQAVEQLTRETDKWHDWNRNGKTEISYTFNTHAQRFNEAQKRDARRSMQSWSDVANLDFTENGRQAEGRLSFGVSSQVDTAVGFFPTVLEQRQHVLQPKPGDTPRSDPRNWSHTGPDSSRPLRRLERGKRA